MKLKLEDVDPSRSAEEWSKLIDSWIFNEETRKLLKRHFLDGAQYGDLSSEFNIDIDTVKYRIYTAQKKLFQHI